MYTQTKGCAGAHTCLFVALHSSGIQQLKPKTPKVLQKISVHAGIVFRRKKKAKAHALPFPILCSNPAQCPKTRSYAVTLGSMDIRLRATAFSRLAPSNPGHHHGAFKKQNL